MSQINKTQSKQDKAIHEYLESLLLEVDDTQPDEAVEAVTSVAPLNAQPQTVNTRVEKLPHSEADVSSAVIGLEKLVAEVPDVITETVTDVKTETVTQDKVEIKEDVQFEHQVESEVKAPANTETGIPDWAESRFQCLLFKVSGLSLAVPLVKLNSVIPWSEEITQTPNQTEWYLGLVQHLQKQVKIIDTALLVMPENRHEKIQANPSERLSHILLVDDSRWGLACDSIGDVIWLTKDEVKWRKNKNSRAWLSGTSLEHLCAIMDTEVFAKMLVDAE